MARESRSASLHMSETFMEMWCEIRCFQHHPRGLRRLFLPTQGHWVSERRTENVRVLCSQRWKQVTKLQEWAYLEARHYSLCVSGLLAFLL